LQKLFRGNVSNDYKIFFYSNTSSSLPLLCRIYSGNEISQIFFIVFLPFVGRVKKRPLFMSLSTALAAIGLFIIALPHFTGDQNYLVT
jgi:hypothetical protein